MTNICTVVRGILKMYIWLCVDDNLLQKNECLNFSEWLHIHWIYSSSIMDALQKGLSWSWPYGSWIYDYLFNQCISPLMLRVQIPLRGVCFVDTGGTDGYHCLEVFALLILVELMTITVIIYLSTFLLNCFVLSVQIMFTYINILPLSSERLLLNTKWAIFNYVMSRTSYFTMKWWWYPSICIMDKKSIYLTISFC